MPYPSKPDVVLGLCIGGLVACVLFLALAGLSISKEANKEEVDTSMYGVYSFDYQDRHCLKYSSGGLQCWKKERMYRWRRYSYCSCMGQSRVAAWL